MLFNTKRSSVTRAAQVFAGMLCLGLCVSSSPCFGQGIDRLLNQADVSGQHRADDDSADERKSTTTPEVACLVPNTIDGRGTVVRTSFQDQGSIKLADPNGFVDRDSYVPGQVMPLPVGRIERAQAAAKNITPGRLDTQFDRRANQESFIFDGNDRGTRTTVDDAWNVYGLDTEDTVGHFDTLDGQRIVTPSNRVAIYAPRFAAVRKVHGAFSANRNQQLVAAEERMQTVYSQVADRMTSSKQNLSLNHHQVSKRASGLLDQTRGVVADNTTNLFGFRNSFEPYANIEIMRMGRYHDAQGPLLSQGMQAAVAWETDLGLRVHSQGLKPIIVRDVRTVQELMSVESEDGTAILRVVKIADKMAARTGEEVEFTIRFDNISRKKIGNVTIMDNLTRRLEYVADSQECSVDAKFINEVNEDESLLLRWEVNEPMDAGTGGVIRFRCKVR
ncbi:MAG: hypothetical protein AAFN77_20095 [Planctomycetota bacterium]